MTKPSRFGKSWRSVIRKIGNWLRVWLKCISAGRCYEWGTRKAEGSLDQALVHDPKNVRCRYFRALYDWKRERHIAAANRLRDLAEQCGEDARILYHAGLRLLLNGEPEPALRYLERAAQQRESYYGRLASWAIANHHVGEGQYAEAEAILAGTAWST